MTLVAGTLFDDTGSRDDWVLKFENKRATIS
jgi:hypothetical protein